MKFEEFVEANTNNRQILLNELIDSGKLTIVCPQCGSYNVNYDNATCTCVGGRPNPNHYWREFECFDCKLKCCCEHKYHYDGRTNVWFTDQGLVLYGINSCSEKYFYKCKCGGKLHKQNIDKKSGKESNVLSYGPGYKSFYTIAGCDDCLKQVEVSE